MLIYNAFPFAYSDLNQVTDQLEKLDYMGFQIVWFNPIQYSRRYDGFYGGSLYSMNRDDLFLSQWQGGDVKANEMALDTLSKEAKQRGMTLMFDLVMNQVGRRLAQNKKYVHLFSNPDRGEFDYSSPRKRQQAFDELFKPFIERYVKDYGFTGMRIDAAGVVPCDMQRLAIDLFRALCRKHHNTDGIVLGEYLESNEKISHFLQEGIKYDLITNSSHWSVNSSPYLDPSKRGVHNSDMGERRQITTQGTIGWTGNHDVKTLYQYCDENLPKHTNQSVAQRNTTLAKMMRERIAVMAFISDGGYYLLSGDEFGSSQPRSCFEWEKDKDGEPALRKGQTYLDNWGGKFDMTEFIRTVNLIRHNLNKNISAHFWSEQYIIGSDFDPNHSVKCVVRNNGGGFSGSMDIVLVNINPNPGFVIEINSKFINHLKEQIRSSHHDFDIQKKDINIHLAGAFSLKENLPYECFSVETAPVLLDEDIKSRKFTI